MTEPKTEFLIKRQLFGKEITQRSKSEMFSLTDLAIAGNQYRVSNNMSIFDLKEYLRRPSTLEFIKALEKKTGEKVLITRKSKGQHVWGHPYLMIDFALAISPELKVEVYGWLHDFLIRYRNLSAVSYKKMAGALWENTSKDHRNFGKYMAKVALKIQDNCKVKDWNVATQDQLELIDKVHDRIALLCDVLRDNDQAVELALRERLSA